MRTNPLPDTRALPDGQSHPRADTRSPTARQAFRADRARYPRHAWATRRSLWAIAAFRLTQAAAEQPKPTRTIARGAAGVLALAVRVITNIEIPTGTRIGPGLRIGHGGPIVIARTATIGANCSMSVGVVIGTRGGSAAPSLGDDVMLGAYAVALGDITIGSGAQIGAMSLVLHDVPVGASVGGNPARILS